MVDISAISTIPHHLPISFSHIYIKMRSCQENKILIDSSTDQHGEKCLRISDAQKDYVFTLSRSAIRSRLTRKVIHAHPITQNSWWTICQVRATVEVQLDPHMPRKERLRRLCEVATKIEYWQRQAEKAARCHIKRRQRKLRSMGIRISKARKCYNVF